MNSQRHLQEADTNFDCIIIGAGGAGCRAAVELQRTGHRIAILSHDDRELSTKTFKAQGGIQAALGAGDSPELHYEDTMKAGKYANNPRVVRRLVDGASEAVRWLMEEIGVQFDRNADGVLQFSMAGGLSRPRILTCKGSAGEGIARPLWAYVDAMGIPTLTGCQVHHATRGESGFRLHVSQDGEQKSLDCQALVLAAGGSRPSLMRLGLQMPQIPDGLDLARQLGAIVKSPELMQYHPTGVIEPATLRRIRLPETMRGAGAQLRNRQSKIFTNALASRQAVVEAIRKEIEQGNGVRSSDGYQGVWLDTTMIDRQQGDGFLEANYPSFHQRFIEEGHDLCKEMVLVYPVVHYSLGGVEIDENAQTAVSGLFAAGEVTWGVHGEDRLMGNSLLDVFVFGKIAGQSAARYVSELKATA
ncbi:MAG: FAD-binding protein [Saprospiraceae bacterium]|nr:FAD-binding protein [Saprospiraceae bacterium]